jgi:hypothetical protein
MIISEITYTIDESGKIVRLQIGPRDGYVNSPGKTGSKKDAAAKKAAGEWSDVAPADTKAPKVNNNTKAKKGGEWSDVKAKR